MKKTLIAGVLALSSVTTFANCVVEMQYQGMPFGQNIFQANQCRDAIRECKKTSKKLEREVMFVRRNSSVPFFMHGDLQCVKMGDVVGPGPGPGNDDVVVDPTPIDTNPMSRYEALSILETIENDTNQANQDFDLIMSFVNSGTVFVSEGVDVFVAIINSTGSGSTTDAQNTFRNVMDKYIATGVSPMELASVFVNSNRIEVDNNQANENLNLVVSLMSVYTETVAQAGAEFHRVLNLIGKGSTTDARDLFTTIVESKRQGTRLSRVVDIVIEIQRMENNAAQTGENIALVNQAAKIPGVTFSEASATMISLLERHGAGSTTTIQNKFRRVYGM